MRCLYSLEMLLLSLLARVVRGERGSVVVVVRCLSRLAACGGDWRRAALLRCEGSDLRVKWSIFS